MSEQRNKQVIVLHTRQEKIAELIRALSNHNYGYHPEHEGEFFCSLCGVRSAIGPFGVDHAVSCPVILARELAELPGRGGVVVNRPAIPEEARTLTRRATETFGRYEREGKPYQLSGAVSDILTVLSLLTESEEPIP